MPGLKYITRIVRGMKFDTMKHMADVVKQKCGQSKLRTYCSMVWCGLRYGAGYYDYVMFGFYDMNGKQRDTYLTRVRNKKVFELMNDYSYGEEFDDKLRFNQRFADFLRRKTLNGETATVEQLDEFLQGQECFFAKPNHGSCGQGVERVKVADFENTQAILDYIHKKNLPILEHAIKQHPDMAKLHPSSVNTIRIVTDIVDNEVLIAYVMVKIGRGGGCCDNTGQGGMLCRVDEKTGKIRSVAQDDYFNVFDKHPDTGISFIGYQLPMIPEAMELAKKAALVIPQMRHVGWDVAITPDGPVIVEGNEYAGTDLCQLASHYPEKCGLWPYYKRILNLK